MTMLIIPPSKFTTAKGSTDRLWRVSDKHMAGEYENVKVLGAFTVAGSLIAATRNVSTMAGLKGAKLIP